jgi:hypothetical protein
MFRLGGFYGIYISGGTKKKEEDSFSLWLK